MKGLMFVLLMVISLSAGAVDPESNQVNRLVAIIANITNSTTVVSDAKVLNIANHFVSHWQSEFDSSVADPENPTNNEKAGFVILKIKQWAQPILRDEGRKAEENQYQSAVDAAGDAAAADLD